jgi:glyoxylase-like metal-dependent hydrolase (beta-lactamase superfamily II)
MHVGDWQVQTINGGSFWIDGGVMFGIVPRTLWSQVIAPDEANRIRCGGHCLLARNGRHTVLVDAGYGGKYGQLDRRFYGMEPGEPLLASLAQCGVTPEQVDYVLFSHLHFDHAGGATRYDDRRRLVPTFPKARHVIGRWEWDDAVRATPELQTAYNSDNLLPLDQAGLVDLVDGNAEILPGLRMRITGGHTRGHMAILIQSAGQTVAFLGDMCPSRAHLRRMWHTAYDQFPLDTRRTKPVWLGQAADEQWLVVWNHDPQMAVGRVQRHPRREFDVVDAQPGL